MTTNDHANPINNSLLFATVVQLGQGFYSSDAAMSGKRMPVDQIVDDAKRLIDATGNMIAAEAFAGIDDAKEPDAEDSMATEEDNASPKSQGPAESNTVNETVPEDAEPAAVG